MAKIIAHVIGQLVRGGTEGQLVRLVDILSTREWTQYVITFNPGDSLEKDFIKEGVTLIKIKRHWNKFQRLLDLQNIISDINPDIIHSWSKHTNIYLKFLHVDQSKTKKIASIRENPAIDLNRRDLLPFQYSWIYKNFDCILSNNVTGIKYINANAKTQKNIHYVGNFIINKGKAYPGEYVPIPKILAVGSLVKIKGYDTLLYAAKELNNRKRPFLILIAGRGPELSNLQELVSKFQLQKSVKFLGEVEDIPTLLKEGHIFVHPSWSEGLSNSILEAMYAGLPVVITNVGDTEKYINPGNNGFLFSPGDYLKLTDKLEDLLSRPKLRQEIGERASSDIMQKFDDSTIIAKYESIYNSLIGDIT
jgi:glycosyltransferase involved in cell wall biosynthesis